MYIYERPNHIEYKIDDIIIEYDENHKGVATLLQDGDTIVIPIKDIDTIRKILADVVTLSKKDDD